MGVGANYSRDFAKDVRLTKERLWQHSNFHTWKWYFNFPTWNSDMFLFSTYSTVLLCSCMVSLFSFAGQQTPHNSSLEDWSRVNYLHAYVGSLVDALRYYCFYFHFPGGKLKECTKADFAYSFSFLFYILTGLD